MPWTACAGCWNGDDPKRIVICEGCEVEYHTYCLNPPLDEVRKRLTSKCIQTPLLQSYCAAGSQRASMDASCPGAQLYGLSAQCTI